MPRVSHARKRPIGEHQTYMPTVIHDTAEGTGAKERPASRGTSGGASVALRLPDGKSTLIKVRPFP